MLWERMNSLELKAAASDGLVAVLPVGSVETHGPHMPLGTDTLTIYMISERAAEIEPAVVLPPLCYAYVLENRHFPGTISLSAETLLKLLEEVCDEVARNGFRKVFVVNGHGGNNDILRVFMRESLTERKGYSIYAMIDPWAPIGDLASKLSEGRVVGHACELETSLGLYLFEELVRVENVKQEASTGGTGLPSGIESPVDWQAYATQLYLGDPRLATKEKGRALVERTVGFLVDALRRIKQDVNIPRVLDEFYSKAYGESRGFE